METFSCQLVGVNQGLIFSYKEENWAHCFYFPDTVFCSLWNMCYSSDGLGRGHSEDGSWNALEKNAEV